MAPTLVASRTTLPPEWANFPRGGPSENCVPPAKYKAKQGGFTLIELLVAITIMALLAILSWRGLDGMARAQTQTSQRADEVLTLQAGLAQWKVDLDALTQTPQVNSLDWDGRVLRLTRRTSSPGEGLQVVAWTRRADAGGQWLRWQSPVLRTLGGWNEAWSRASVWAQSASTEDRAREVLVVPLEDWKIFYFRGDAWTNPLSSDAGQTPVASTPGGTPTAVATGVVQTVAPEGIRLVLSLPAGPAISGKITLDWVRPTIGGDKS
ncbi:MAG: prepilin-type N-terminal cleavage/methylation domain-containing protein [Polaromonas sp.]|nr:prepilin-type N-terminal cleavage/methylation domain-containing protein [Polaromonas sp.]